MATKTNQLIKLGVFVTLAIILLITGIYFIGQKQRMFSDVFSISGIFKNVGGLRTGNNVRFGGINVGIVDNIQIINDTSVKVDMIIEEDVHQFIKKDAEAMIGSEGLMGNKTINISHGSPNAKPVEPNGFILTRPPVDTDEILAKLKTTADNAATISGGLAVLSENISKGKGTIGKLFMDTIMANQLNQTIVNLKQGTKSFDENMDAAKNSFLLRGAFKKKKNKEKEK